MNKKFLSAILFGALALASTGSFVSCKDYDDDIKNLQTQIETLATKSDVEAKLSQMKAELSSAKTDAESARQEAAAALAAAKAAADSAAGAKQDAANNSAEIAKLQSKIDALDARIKAIEDAQAAVDKAIADVKSEVANKLSDFEKSTKESIDAAIAKVESILAAVKTQLKSLVFQPEYYLDGVEAADYTYLKYAALCDSADIYKGDAKNNLENDVKIDEKYVWGYRHAGDIKKAVPAQVNHPTNYEQLKDAFVPVDQEKPFVVVGVEDSVKFALNPVDSKVTKESLKLVAKNVALQTRGKDEEPKVAELEITRVATNKGILTVYYKVNNPLDIITANNWENWPYTLDKTPNTTVFELQAFGADSLINSDFAVVYENLVKPVAVGINSKANAAKWTASDLCSDIADSPELYKNPYEALKAVPTAKLAYNDPKGIDLNEYLNIHMVMVDEENTKVSTKHYAITLAEAKAKYDLDVVYSMVPYETESDGNLTRPSNYVKLTNGVVVAGTVDANGNFSAQQGPSSVNKQPLVQVLVKRGNDVVLDGYVKLTISREIGDKVAPVFDLGKKDWNCDGVEFKQTWAQVSALLLEQTVNMSKLEFEAAYKLVKNTDGTTAVQYAIDSKTGDFVVVPVKDTYTEITERVDTEGTTNTVLGMELDTYAQQYVYEMTGHFDILYVKYVRKEDNATDEGVYVPLQITMKERTTASLKTKNVNYWFAGDGTTKTSPDEALRFNVNYPKDGGNTTKFESQIVNAWEGNKLVVVGTDGKELKDQPDTKYYFHPATNNVVVTDEYTGTKYQLSVQYDSVVCHLWTAGEGPTFKKCPGTTTLSPVLSEKFDSISFEADPIAYTQKLELEHKLYTANGKTMYDNVELSATELDKDGKKVGTATVIATLNPSTGQVLYLNNVMAKVVLNAVSHVKAEAKVYVGVYYTDKCGHAASIAQNVFPAFFLRPIDIDQPTPGEVLDAKANGDLISVLPLFNFTDWRDVKFIEGTAEEPDYKNIWLLAYYNVNSITVDLDNAITNMNNHSFDEKVKIKDVNDKIKFTYQSAVSGTSFAPSNKNIITVLSSYNKESLGTSVTYEALVKAYGQIKYENNGANVSDFDVKVPVTFGYDWGTITTELTIHVKGTMANND